ncbi:MAG: ATP-binding protein [Acidobacteriota bacterium]
MSPTNPIQARLEREAALTRRIQEVLLRFSGGISSTLNVGDALVALAGETNAVFGARTSSVWLYERRVRELVLAGSSDPAVAPGLRVGADSDTAAARGLRLERPALSEGGGRQLLAPLRGWRRALGTLVIDEGAETLDDDLLLEGAYQLARQLSVAVENVQLLEDFLQQRRLLENTFNSLVDLVVVVDTSWHVVQMNGAFGERVGRDAGGVIGRPVGEFLGPEMSAWLTAADGVRAAGEPAGRTRQLTDERLGGIFAATVTPLINQDREPVGRVLVARDVSAQVQLEAEREALGRRLAQSERLASLGQFVAGIAHEMNNPLQGVLGHLELLIRSSDEALPVRPTLRRIFREADRAATIVRNLLVFTGSRRMKRVRLRIDRVLSRSLASRSAQLRRERVEVTRSQGEGIPSIAGDALLLQQAVVNVLANAEYAAASGTRPPRIDTTVRVSDDGLTVLLIIGDSGRGIPPEALPHIFNPFFTTKEVGQGTGLGLAITYGIIQEHGGTIQAANRPGGGAEFTINLPAAPLVDAETLDAPSPEAAPAAKARAKAPGRGRRKTSRPG